jgi:exosortase/archaeosortase family protein
MAFGPVAYVLVGRRSRALVAFSLRYLAVFALLLLTEFVFLWAFPSVHDMLRRVAATIVGGILSLAGADASVASPVVSLGQPPLLFDVTAACLGGPLFWVYIGLVCAESTATRKERLRGILFGLVLLSAFNLFRMALGVYVDQLTGTDIHDCFYLFNMLFVLLLWGLWLRTVKPIGNARRRTGRKLRHGHRQDLTRS